MNQGAQGIRWTWLVAAYASLLALGFSDNARSPLFPRMLEDLELSDQAGSGIFALTSLGVTLGSLGSRWLLRRLSVSRGLSLSLLLMALGLVATSLAPELLSLLAASLLFGVGAGGMAVCQNVLCDQAAPSRRRQALAGLHAMYALASLSAPLVVRTLAGTHWRTQVLGFAILPASLALLACLIRTASPEPAERREGAAAPPVAWGLGFVMGTAVSAELLISTRLPLLLERAGHSSADAALYLGLFFGGLLLGRLSFTFLPIPLSGRRVLWLCGALTLGVYAAGLLHDPRWLAAVGLTLSPFFPVATDLLAELCPGCFEAAFGRAVAVVSCLLVGAHLGVGALSDLYGLREALILPVVGLVVGGLAFSRVPVLASPPEEAAHA